MISNEGLSIRGRVAYRIRNNTRTHDWSYRRNLVTSIGKEYLIDRILGNSSDVVAQIQIGGNDTAPTESDTQLAESSPVSKDILFLYKNSSFTNQIVAACTFIDTEEDTPSGFSSGTNEIKEVGLFTNSGLMIARTILNGGFIKNESDILDIVWTITIG